MSDGYSNDPLTPMGRGLGREVNAAYRRLPDPIKARVRQLRSESTDAEARLWRNLRGHMVMG
jgi:very-short-patch-repair endonuclease